MTTKWKIDKETTGTRKRLNSQLTLSWVAYNEAVQDAIEMLEPGELRESILRHAQQNYHQETEGAWKKFTMEMEGIFEKIKTIA